MNADNNRLIFAKNLNYYLSKANKNQNDLVRDLGITASTVSDWANGKKYPRVDKMQLLADYFGVSTDYLLGRTDIETPNSDIQTICEYTGLDEYLIEYLRKFNDKEKRMVSIVIMAIEIILREDKKQ